MAEPSNSTESPTFESVTRMIDMRIPLPWLMTGAIVVAGMQAGMYYSQQQMQRDMAEMKVLLKSNDSTTRDVREELAVQKFRITTIENELAALKANRPR